MYLRHLALVENDDAEMQGYSPGLGERLTGGLSLSRALLWATHRLRMHLLGQRTNLSSSIKNGWLNLNGGFFF